ncbi:ash family protein, partial [Shigella dysenteriae]|nr:ash family protein [Shigella dysenteriae]
GQPPGWPVSCEAGISTPVWAIAIERGNTQQPFINLRFPLRTTSKEKSPTISK